MQRITCQTTERSPFVDFNFPEGRLEMKGESYPEDAASFFGPLLEALTAFLRSGKPQGLTFELELLYFNSSSAKALMNIFQLLEQAAERGWSVRIDWRYHPDDDTMEEFGEDFSEDFEHAEFRLCAIQ